MEIKEDFSNILSKRFFDNCKLSEKPATAQEFIFYLLDKKIIPDKTYRYFMVIHDYPTELFNNNGKRNIAIKNLSDKYNLSERTIYYLLCHQKMYKIK